MAETMTYDAGTDSITTSENLNADEQDSLIVGEQMQAEQEQLLAGKYKNAEDLEKAYVELQKKLGEQGDEDSEEAGDTEDSYEEEEEEEEYEEVEDYSPAAELITEASAEYYENNGELTPETIEKFSSMDSQELVNAYLDLQANQTEEPVEMSDADINTIKNSVGGDDVYSNIVEWAGENLNESSINAFDSIVESGDTAAIQLALSGLKAQYDSANGYEGRMLSGKAPKTSGDTFRSQPELVEAINDPRYENDPAYQQDVLAKLARSDINF
tara:strand:+ start:376 stop:1188 length:813 start_codon:yes stop_codon:yes gene_type:complete